MTVYERLIKYQDEKYREFQSVLVPNVNKNLIIGVRSPIMRKISKEVFGTEEANAFLKDIPHHYYEENIMHMFLVSSIKDFDECIKELETFFPYIDCWPVCDQSSPKVFKKNHKRLISCVKKWIASNHVYTVRYGVRILMNEFLDDDFSEEYLELVSKIRGEDYYLKMMIAWYFATALAKQYDATIKYIEKRKLDEWIHKKTIQKAVESFRVTDEHKKYLKKFR